MFQFVPCKAFYPYFSLDFEWSTDALYLCLCFVYSASENHLLTFRSVDIAWFSQAARRTRELRRKTRALAILLRDDWAKAVLDREKETRAARLQLAQAEDELATQLDSMAGLAAIGSGMGVTHDGNVSRRTKHEGGKRAGESEEEKRRAARGEAEVFLGGAGGGIGMVALQVSGKRRRAEGGGRAGGCSWER